MKSLLLAAVLASATLTAPLCLAQQKAPPPATGSPTKPVAPNTAEFDKQMAQVQESMKKMQEQMDKIQRTQDPQERQRLLQEHWTTMPESMGMMRGLWGPGMMGCCGGGGGGG